MEDEGEAAQPGGGQRRTTHTHRDTTNNQGQAQHNLQDARAFEMPRGGARNGKLWACGNASEREKKKREPESESESEAESEAATRERNEAVRRWLCSRALACPPCVRARGGPPESLGTRRSVSGGDAPHTRLGVEVEEKRQRRARRRPRRRPRPPSQIWHVT